MIESLVTLAAAAPVTQPALDAAGNAAAEVVSADAPIINPQLWVWIAIASALAAGGASALYQALRRVGRTALLARAAKRGPGATRTAEAILQDVDGHAVAVALPRTMLNLASVVFVILWIDSLTPGNGPGLLERSIGVIAGAFILWFVSAVAAQSIARHGSEPVVVAFGPVARLAYLALRPVAPIMSFVDEIVRRLSGAGERSDHDTLEAELRSIVEDNERDGKIDGTEREMIEAVVEFRTKTVEQIMTPRTEVRALEYTDDLREVHDFLRTSGHSRIPVFKENLDHIEGMLYAKDLLNEMADRVAAAEGGKTSNGQAFSLTSILREAVFVPETKTVRELLHELIGEKVHIAMIADEYGGTAGLITVEDILEEIVGEIQDEYETEADGEPSIEVDTGSRTATIEARAYIDDVNDELRTIGAEVPEHEDYDTFGGFVVVTLGRIPEAGETFRHEDLLITVVEAEPTRVSLARVEVRPEDDADHAAVVAAETDADAAK